jgi:cell division protein FtsB
MTYAARLVFIPLVAALICTGCAVVKQPEVSKNDQEYYLALQQNDIPDEIKLLEKMKMTDDDETGTPKHFSADSYYFLALLYSHHNNPAPDYPKALEALEHYGKLVPAEKQRVEIRYLGKLLAEINELTLMAGENTNLEGEKTLLLKKCATLRQEVADLSKENQTLKSSIEQMKNHIEQLKKLDVRLEQKKRAIR